MIVQIILLITGFGILIIGADWLVDGGSALARKYKISELAIGLTIIAFGTSTPELVVNLFAASQSHADIVFGNIIGSNIFNLFAILGIAGIITPLIVQASTVWKEIPISMFATVLIFFLCKSFSSEAGSLSGTDGLILITFFVLFLYYVSRQLKTDSTSLEVKGKEMSVLKIWTYIIAGLALLIAGGRLVVVNSVQIASELGISQKIIGLTIVAIGTSLPELATSVVAAFKRNNDIAVGNIIGSNVFNIFLILGVSSIIRPLNYNTNFNSDIYLLGAGTLFLFVAMFSGMKKKLDRWEAVLFLLTYIGYTIYLIYKE